MVVDDQSLADDIYVDYGGVRYYVQDLSNNVMAGNGNNGSAYLGTTSVTIPSQFTVSGTTYTVTGISDNAFRSTALAGVTIEADNISIGSYAFNNTWALGDVVINGSVSSIGNYAFSGGIKSFTAVGSDLVIGDYAFSGTYALGGVSITGSVSSIGDNAFNNTSMTSFTAVGSDLVIGDYAFKEAYKLGSVSITGSVSSIGDGAFYESSMSSLTITVQLDSFSSATVTFGTGVFSGAYNMTGNNIFIDLSPAPGQDLPSSVSMTIDGIGFTEYSYSSSTGRITMASGYASGEMQINGGESVMYTVTLAAGDSQVTGFTYSVNGGTAQTYSEPFQVGHGSSLSVTALLATGYHLSAWSGYTTGDDNPLTVSPVISDTSLTAVSAINTYTVTFAAAPSGYGSVSPESVTVAYGTTWTADGGVLAFSDGQTAAAIQATADAEFTYSFSSWSSGSGTVSGDTAITAFFSATVNTYAVSWSDPDLGEISAAAGGTSIENGDLVEYGREVTFTYTAFTAGQVSAIEWQGAEESAEYSGGTGQATATVTGPLSVSVTETVAEYALSTSVSNGTITPDTVVEHGSDLTVQYSADTGYHLVSVRVDGYAVSITAHASSYTFTDVESDHTISVVYASDLYDVTLPADKPGIYTVSGASTAIHGSSSSFTITVEDAYDQTSPAVSLAGGTFTSSRTGNTYTYTVSQVTGDLVFTEDQIWRLNVYDVTLPADKPGIYTVSGASTAVHGSSYSFTITVDSAYSQTPPVVSLERGDFTVSVTGDVYTYTVPYVTGDLVFTETQTWNTPSSIEASTIIVTIYGAFLSIFILMLFIRRGND